MIGRGMAAAAIIVALTACAGLGPSISAPSPSASTIPSSGGTAAASATPEGLAPPDPGRPFDATTILEAMRDSRRPDGVPDELETDAIAAALAEAIWTIDGEPWTMMSTVGSCGPQACTLEIAGADTGAQGEDLWVFEVPSDSGDVRVVSADLRSVPSDLIAELDTLTRSLFPSGTIAEVPLTNVRWLPPPDETQFVISYRSGGEEGSCSADITVDVVVPSVVSHLILDC